jgi:hypothetical protein
MSSLKMCLVSAGRISTLPPKRSAGPATAGPALDVQAIRMVDIKGTLVRQVCGCKPVRDRRSGGRARLWRSPAAAHTGQTQVGWQLKPSVCIEPAAAGLATAGHSRAPPMFWWRVTMRPGARPSPGAASPGGHGWLGFANNPLAAALPGPGTGTLRERTVLRRRVATAHGRGLGTVPSPDRSPTRNLVTSR